MEQYINQKVIIEGQSFVVSDIDKDFVYLRKLGTTEFYEANIDDTEILDEKLSISSRRKMAISARKNKHKMKMGRKRAERKAPTKEKIEARARKRARNALEKKITKGKSKDEMSSSEKSRIEDRLKKMEPRIKRMAKKLLPEVRKDALNKRSGSSNKDK